MLNLNSFTIRLNLMACSKALKSIAEKLSPGLPKKIPRVEVAVIYTRRSQEQTIQNLNEFIQFQEFHNFEAYVSDAQRLASDIRGHLNDGLVTKLTATEKHLVELAEITAGKVEE